MNNDAIILNEKALASDNLKKNRNGERGAALVMALLVTTLLLGLSATLLMTTSMTAVNTYDAAAEMQAYYAAEAGLQATLDVLRGNVAPIDSTLNSSGTKITFLNAVTRTTSNISGDTSTNARLSGWLNYDSIFTDRVSLSTNYSTMSGTAYSVIVTKADNTPISTEPTQVLVQVTGYGPKKAVKKMEMLVTKAFTASFTAPSTITVIGSPSATATISVGQSSAETYTGVDQAKPTATPYPAIAVTTNSDLTAAKNAVTTSNATVSPTPKLLSNSALPYYVQSADQARTTLNDLQDLSQTLSRYYTTGSPPPDIGTPSIPKFTFVDGDLDLSSSYGTGAGLLVVTGNLILNGNYSFQGLILVMGSGQVTRSGGGDGTLEGAMLVASFDRYNYGSSYPFLAPVFNTNGGGNSTLSYNSTYVNNAFGSTVRRPLGIVEK